MCTVLCVLGRAGGSGRPWWRYCTIHHIIAQCGSGTAYYSHILDIRTLHYCLDPVSVLECQSQNTFLEQYGRYFVDVYSKALTIIYLFTKSPVKIN